MQYFKSGKTETTRQDQLVVPADLAEVNSTLRAILAFFPALQYELFQLGLASLDLWVKKVCIGKSQ